MCLHSSGSPLAGAQLRQKRVNLAEGGEYPSVGGPESIAVNGACGGKRSSHVPVADHHAELRVFLAPHDRRKFSEGFRMEFQHELVARISQHGFPAEIKKLKIELRTLERTRHRNHFIRGSAFPDLAWKNRHLTRVPLICGRPSFTAQ